MHELSVAMGIVRIAENETKKAKAKAVVHIELEIGKLAGIAFESLDFVWPAAVKDSVLENASRSIDIIQAKGKCIDCNTVFAMEHLFDSCPNCCSNLKGILQGKELRVKALEVI